jgi:hypothetical protein
MRLAVLLAALLSLSCAAQAQSAFIQGPEHVYVAVPFSIDVSLDCPPPGEAPPPRFCNGTTFAFFEVSDHTAIAPEEAVFLRPFRTFTFGPFVFHKPGPQRIELFTLDEDELLGAFFFAVRPPHGLVKRR